MTTHHYEDCAGAVDPSIADKPSFSQAYLQCPNGTTWTRNRYQASLRAVDKSVMQIIQRLKDTGLYDSTVIVYTSDHGFSMNENNHITKEVPYDTATRVPMFVRMPGGQGGTINALTYLPDLTATFYDITGATPLNLIPMTTSYDGRPQDGKSIVPLLKGEAAQIHADGVYVSHRELQNDAALNDTMPWHAYFEDCSVVENCKAIIKYDNGEYELYDLKNDPYQLTNLLPNSVTGYPGVTGWDNTNPEVQDLKAKLEQRITNGV